MKIAACYSSRADYAPLYPVMSALKKRGAEVWHFSLDDVKVEDDTPYSCCLFLTKWMNRLADRFSKSKPDLVLILGDRYEALGSAQVATLFQIPIAHIHGGETTEGSFDNEFRHAITQLATYHFVSAERHAGLVAAMRGSPLNVHVVGAPGLDNISDLPLREFPGKYFLVTYHPVTKGKSNGHLAIIEALKSFPEYGVVWTGVNNDPGRIEILTSFQNTPGIMVVDDMEPKRYLSAMKYAACCIGNSSSFLIEAPALGVAAVNVGDRQKGRLHGDSVLDAPEDASEISRIISIALNMPDKGVAPIFYRSPYGGPGASAKIADILMGVA